MAVSINLLTPEPYAVGGGYVETLAEVTFDSSYPTGGEAVTANQFKLGTILHMDCQVAPATGVVASFDRANLKIKLFWVDTTVDGAELAEVTASDDQSAAVVPVRVIGRP